MSPPGQDRCRQVPVTLVTGFLGAGKTTVVNHLLHTAAADRIAVVENEFGDAGVDGALVDAPRDLVFELTEGCVCCTVRADLLDVFEGLARRAEGLDHVIVETSGLASPGPVVQVFERPQLQGRFRLDGVVTVVDAGHVARDLDDTATCGEQIVAADLIVLHKVDQAHGSVLSELEARLRQLNPLARLVRASRGQVPWGQVAGARERTTEPGLGQSPARPNHDHHHDDDIVSVVAETREPLDLDALDRWLGRLVRRPDLDLLRMKGLLAVRGHARRFVFHGVREAIEVQPGAPWGAERRVTKLVFIGRGLDAEELQEGLSKCSESRRPTAPLEVRRVGG